MNFPFLVFGLVPGDWYEGGHTYEIRFREAPDAATRRALGKKFEDALASGPAEVSSDTWEWSGPYALARMEPRWDAGESFFEHAGEVLRALHAICPIVEVNNWAVREAANDPWTRATLALQPVPRPGPSISKLKPPFYDRAIDATLPPYAADKEFEAARREARSAATVAVAGQRAEVALERGELAWVPVESPQEPAAATPVEKPAAVGAFAGAFWITHLPDGTVVAAWSDIVKMQRPGEDTPQKAFVADGESGPILRCASTFERTLVVMCKQKTHVLDLDDVVVGPVLSLNAFGATLCSARGGRLCVLCIYGRTPVMVIGIVGKQAKVLGRSNTKIDYAYELDGKVFGRVLGVGVCELQGSDAAWDEFAASLAARKPKKTKTKALALALAPVDASSVSAKSYAVAPEIIARFPEGAWVLVSPSGRAVGLIKPSEAYSRNWGALTWLDDHGEWRTLPPERNNLPLLGVSDDGKVAAYAQQYAAHLVNLATGEDKVVLKASYTLDAMGIVLMTLIGNDRLVVRSQKRIVVVDQDGKLLGERKISGELTFYTLDEGRVLACQADGKHKLVVLGVGDEGLVLLGQFDTNVQQLSRSADGVLFAKDGLGQWYELTGVAEARRAKLGGP